MQNFLVDVNVILDYYSKTRSKKFPDSVKVLECCLKESRKYYISSSSLDNIAYLKAEYLRLEEKVKSGKKRKEAAKDLVKFLVSNFRIAKTPSYIEIDYEDIEGSQIIASAKAIDAKVITRDEGMLEKYPNIAISPSDYLKTKNQKPKTTIDFANLKKQYFMYQPELEKEMDKVLNNASYIMGDAVKELESNLCDFTGAKHAITCSSGTDALLLAMMALDIKPGDEIITTPFTFIATAETIALLGAKPVFVDIDEKAYNIDPDKIETAITPKTKAIMPVSLYGQSSDMDAIQAIADQQLKTKNQKLHIIIDGAQSFGATYQGEAEVHHCDIYTTSFFPAKPLGCFGDGGAVLTNHDDLAEKMRMLRVHGQNKRYHHKYIGLGGRMDTIQCAVVNVKLKYYKKDLSRRQEVAQKYTELLSNNQYTNTPITNPDRSSAWAQYSIRIKSNNQKPETRNQIQVQLKKQGIPTAVHYPMPLHLQECFAYLGYKKSDFPIAERVSQEIMSLPMNPYLSDEEVGYIAQKIKEVL